jgi:hypothetical protein
MRKTKTPHSRRPSVLVALLHERLNQTAYTCLADLLADLKTRLVTLRIPYPTHDALNAALAHIEYGAKRPLVTLPPPEAVRAVSSRGSEDTQRGPAPHGGTA